MAGPSVAIIGIGETPYVRGTSHPLLRLLLEASVAACDDAGISSHDVDGVIAGQWGEKAADFAASLGMRELSFSSYVYLGGASAVLACQHAIAAIEQGLANFVLAPIGIRGYSENRLSGLDPEVMTRIAWMVPNAHIRRDFEHPYGFSVPAQWYGMVCRRWLHDMDIDRDVLAAVALTQREHAALNGNALLREKRLTREEYFAAPVISDPFLLYDCCIEADGAGALLFTSMDRARSMRRPPIAVLGVGEGHNTPADEITNRPDLKQIGVTQAGRRAFELAGLGPDDVDFAELYDPFTFLVPAQLKELDLCRGMSVREFVLSDHTKLGGKLPVNTHGGLLSQAHVMGMNHMIEIVRQLRHEAGDAQVEGARVGLVTGLGDFLDQGVAILAREERPR